MHASRDRRPARGAGLGRRSRRGAAAPRHRAGRRESPISVGAVDAGRSGVLRRRRRPRAGGLRDRRHGRDSREREVDWDLSPPASAGPFAPGNPVTKAPAARSFEVRHVQLARAAFAAIAAIMVTFSPDHSSVDRALDLQRLRARDRPRAARGRMARLPGRRALADRRCSASISVIAGLAGGIAQLRNDTMFFVIVIAWALLSRSHRDDHGRTGSARAASRAAEDGCRVAPSRATA